MSLLRFSAWYCFLGASGALLVCCGNQSLQAQPTTLAVTEFLADPTGTDTDFEWVEIYNYGNAPVNLAGWRLQDTGTNNIALPSVVVGGGSYIVLAADATDFQARWGASPNVYTFSGTFSVANSGDELLLVDGIGTQRWGVVYPDGETASRAAFLTGNDFSTTSFNVVFNGNDAPGVSGYQSNNFTADTFAVTAGGDTGSPLAGQYTPSGPVPTSIYSHALPVIGQTTTIDFNNFVGLGFHPTPAIGQLDSDNFAVTGFSDGSVAFGGTGATGDFARGLSTGGVTTGGIYAFTAAGSNTLGVQPTADDFTPGSITLRLPNESTEIIEALTVSADILINNNEDRSNTLVVSYSTDGIVFTDLADFDSVAALDASGFQAFDFMAAINGVSIDPGEFLFLRFTGDDIGGSNSRDEFAIDNLQISALAIPEPSMVALWAIAGAVVVGLSLPRSRSHSKIT